MICTKCRAMVDERDGFCRQCGAPLATMETRFVEAEGALAALRKRFEAGTLAAAAFEAEAGKIVVEHRGEFWMPGIESGRWYVHRNGAWQEAEPPRRQGPARAAAAPPDREAGTAAAPRPARVRLHLATLAGFVLAIAATMVPWYAGSTGDFSYTSSVWDFDPDYGFWTAGLAGTGIAIALLLLGAGQVRAIRWLGWLVPVIGGLLVALGLDAYDEIDLGTVELVTSTYSRTLEPGPPLVIGGGILACVAGVAALFRRG